MALIMLASAGYAYYQFAVNQAGEDIELDEALVRSGKTELEFLPNEVAQGILKISLTTVTHCKGDCRKVAPLLEQRVKDIRRANPWLTGFLAPPEGGGDVKLFYDSDPESEHFQKAPSSFRLFEPGEIPLTQLTPIKNYDDICQCFDIKVHTTDKLLGKNKALWRVTMIPDAAEPEDKWILVVSMCRLFGDAQTFYMLYNQLGISQPVSSLNPNRKVAFREEAAAHLGSEEFQYMSKLRERAKKEADNKNDGGGGLGSFFSGTTEEPKKEKAEPAHEMLVFRVATDWMEKEKAEHPEVEEGCLVASWFCRRIRPEVVLVALSLRGILPVLNDFDAGNYASPLPMMPEDYDAPSGIQSSLTSGKRKTHGETVLPEAPGSFGIAADWSRFAVAVEGGEEEGATFEQTMHFPLLDSSDLRCVPKEVCGLVLFKASEGRLGAMCIVPKGMVSELQGTGIIDTTFSEYARKKYAEFRASIRASTGSVEGVLSLA